MQIGTVLRCAISMHSMETSDLIQMSVKVVL